jgi:hypothetical protein
MIIAIVGSAADKFDRRTERIARAVIRHFVRRADEVISGDCHLGGIDQWTIEEAKKLKVPFRVFPPAQRSWSGGYKARNIRMAEVANRVVSIVPAKYPRLYRGMRFRLCYHCRRSDHIKSGGCWTARYARGLGKQGETVVIY